MSGYIFSTTNKDGIKVVLDTNTFNKHIVPGHPEMLKNILAMQDSIESPEYIIQSSKNENSLLYITQSSLSTYPKMYIKTVVDHTNPHIGFVKTAFFQRKLDPEKEGVIVYEQN